jgi:hypothetical protein
LLAYRRHVFLRMGHLERKTTPFFGKAEARKKPDNMEWALP